VTDRAKKRALWLGALLIVADLALLTSGKRILVSERMADNDLRCSYFTGRSVQYATFGFSENNIMGRDQCPFVTSENP
jgi:uncharacterized protein YodC (DUF2158 family)